MRVKANVVLAKCRTDKELYGMRVEERSGDWIRTWAFRIKEEMARYEGFDQVEISGSFLAMYGYPGCPYCGETKFTVCGACKKISCYHGEKIATCKWCGYSSEVETVKTLDVTGGGF